MEGRLTVQPREGRNTLVTSSEVLFDRLSSFKLGVLVRLSWD
jgi:hypothetical protein